MNSKEVQTTTEQIAATMKAGVCAKSREMEVAHSLGFSKFDYVNWWYNTEGNWIFNGTSPVWRKLLKLDAENANLRARAEKAEGESLSFRTWRGEIDKAIVGIDLAGGFDDGYSVIENILRQGPQGTEENNDTKKTRT